MRVSFGALLTALAVLVSLASFAPGHAFATEADDIANMDCQKFDSQVATNRQQFQRNLFSQDHNINTLFPIAKASNQCIQNLENLIMGLSTGSPSSIGDAIAKALVAAVASEIVNACQQVMGSIMSAESAFNETANICLPALPFGGLNLPHFTGISCLGGPPGQAYPLTKVFNEQPPATVTEIPPASFQAH